MALYRDMETLMDKVSVTDFRVQGRVKYPLLPLLFSIIMAWCAGYNSSLQAADFIRGRKSTLAEIIPGFGVCGEVSHDTVLRQLKLLNFSELNAFLYEFCGTLLNHKEELPVRKLRTLSLDGQTPRSVIYEPEEGQKSPQDRRAYSHQYYVTLYDSSNRLPPAQADVMEKENENKACIRLLDLFSPEGCVVTCDALNTQRPVAEKIIEKNGDYCCALKDNHKTLAREVMSLFNNSEVLDEYAVYSQADTELAHGRMQSRLVIALPAELIKSRVLGEWKADTRTVFFARTCTYDKKYRQYKEPVIRLYLSSLDPGDPHIAEYGMQVIRSHWAIENSQHYVLDVCYGQDMLRAKNRNFIRNALLLNKIALNTARIAQRDSTDRQMSVTRIKKIMSFDPGLLCRSLCKGITADSGTDKAV